MNKSAALWVAGFLMCSFAALAQDDDTIQYNHGIPETVEDTSQQIPQDQLPADSFVQISVEQIPQELYKTLSREPQYKGWEQAVILLDKNTDLYWVKLKDAKVIRSYAFDRKGNPVSVKEENIATTE